MVYEIQILFDVGVEDRENIILRPTHLFLDQEGNADVQILAFPQCSDKSLDGRALSTNQ